MVAGMGSGPWRVLVVDDEENLNWSLVNSLRKEGYTTDGALSGEDALRRLETTTYDCVLSDVKMPGMDGFELLQWVRRRRPQTRIIMMTAFGSPTARQDAMRAGVIAYLEKPFDLLALKNELRRLAAGEVAGAAEGEGYDLLEVARVLNLARRDMALSVQGGGHSGRLRFLRGELIWAEAGALQGDAAFLALCTTRGGRAQPESWDGRADRNVWLPVSHLIYQALTSRDSHTTGATGPLSVTRSTLAPAAPGATVSAAAVAVPPTTLTPALDQAPAMAAITTTDTEIMSAVPAASTMTAVAAGAAPRSAEEVGQPASRPSAVSTAPPITASLPVPPVTPDAGSAAVAEPVEALARTLGTPCGVALLRIDGAVLAQCWQGLRPRQPRGRLHPHERAHAPAASRGTRRARRDARGHAAARGGYGGRRRDAPRLRRQPGASAAVRGPEASTRAGGHAGASASSRLRFCGFVAAGGRPEELWRVHLKRRHG